LLENNKFQWNVESSIGNGLDFDKDENGDYNIAQLEIGMWSALMSCDRDDTERIKSSFLQKNNIAPKIMWLY
jgi:hypothetical protein